MFDLTNVRVCLYLARLIWQLWEQEILGGQTLRSSFIELLKGFK